MSDKDIILKAENISKQYRLGVIGTGTISHDLNRWWRKVRGNEDPYLKIGEVNDRAVKANSEFVWALKDINFEVKKGEVLGIIGKNGAGKSTLLKILSRVTGPTTGSIKSAGRIASLLEVGTGFHPELTGKENIFLNGAILGMTKAEIKDKLDEIVEFSGCERYVDTPVKRYSSGMRVRLAFAVAAFLEPDILVVDEVLAVGDAEFQKKAIGKMQEISGGEGKTVLFVSHNMNSIRALCTRGLILENGMVKFIGDIDKAVSQYLSINGTTSLDILDQTEGRTGSGELRIKSVDFFDKKAEKVESIFSGDSVEIKIAFQAYGKIDFSKIIFSVLFRDFGGNEILSFVTDEMNSVLSSFENSLVISLIIPNLYLRANNYYLRIRLNKEGNTGQKYVVDQLESAATLNVLEGDLWKIGKSNRPGAMAIIPGKFES